MSLMTLLLAFISFDAHSADAPISPAACYMRVYEPSHLKQNPNQALTSLAVKLVNHEEYVGAQVIGLGRNGRHYANSNAVCESRDDGSIFCFVECDGGSFRLQPARGSVNFRVTESYYFPLILNGIDPEVSSPEDYIWLDGDDRDNNIYKLYPASAAACDVQFSKLKEDGFGC